MRSTSARIIVAGFTLLTFQAMGSEPAPAQELEFDEQRQVFVLTYEDDTGQERSVEIVGPNRIRPSTAVSIERQDDRYRYAYRLGNRHAPGSTQAIRSWQLRCPSVVEATAPDDWVVRVREDSGASAVVCDFRAETGDFAVSPGSSVPGFEIESSSLPAISRVRAWGVLGEAPPALPGIEGEMPRDIGRLYNRALGIEGAFDSESGWRLTDGIAPIRDPVQFRDPGILLPAIRNDLERVCDLDWISNRGICNSLQQKLRNAGRSLDRGKTKAARNQIRAFVKELEAQHGDPPGKHVNDNAFALLKTNAEFLVEEL